MYRITVLFSQINEKDTFDLHDQLHYIGRVHGQLLTSLPLPSGVLGCYQICGNKIFEIENEILIS